ncbi:hypothetical protein GCM10025789_16040 [Tessaracoccus lubricantis]|uniref:Uncharacterized protein n=1 Tax=Tessaracoccus lubricantis TaxID=545543 RepID=A0ABP9FLF5_9ACTN
MVLAAVLLAAVSLVSNMTTPAQLAGDVDGVLAVRLTLSKLANSGTAWAGLLVLAGRIVRDPRQAAAAGILSGWLSLAIHYGLGQLAGIFTPHIWAENLNWFLITGAVGAPLGLVGAATGRADGLGQLSRLVIPLGAVVEPFYRGMFAQPDVAPWPGVLSSMACGSVLAGLGAAGLVVALRRPAGRARSLDSAP